MGNPRSRESSGNRSRAYLFLSLILLVWNTAATARQAYDAASPPGDDPVAASPVPALPEDPSPTPDSRLSARNGPYSARQKFLLGKRVDINRATEREISGLPGISDAVAAAMVKERKRRGGFRSPAELLAVRGIKEKRLEKILPFLAPMENN